jgi:hypothetical protein
MNFRQNRTSQNCKTWLLTVRFTELSGTKVIKVVNCLVTRRIPFYLILLTSEKLLFFMPLFVLLMLICSNFRRKWSKMSFFCHSVGIY